MDAICPAGRHRSNSAPNENDVEEQPDRSPRPPKRHVKHFLPKRDRVILLNCWKKTKKVGYKIGFLKWFQTGPDHVGIKIFYMILTAQPDIKDIFDLEKVAAGQLKYDTRFRQQAASE